MSCYEDPPPRWAVFWASIITALIVLFAITSIDEKRHDREVAAKALEAV